MCSFVLSKYWTMWLYNLIKIIKFQEIALPQSLDFTSPRATEEKREKVQQGGKETCALLEKKGKLVSAWLKSQWLLPPKFSIIESDLVTNTPELSPSCELPWAVIRAIQAPWILIQAPQERVMKTTKTSMTRRMSSFERKTPAFRSLGVRGTNTSRALSPAVPALLPP